MTINAMKVDVSIIIVNYNTGKLLVDCIKSIIENTRLCSFEIIVVDNDSPDEDIYQILSSINDIRIIKNKKNIGFGSANNIGASSACGQYVLFLNPDTILQNDAISMFYEWFEKNHSNNIGAIGAWLCDINRMKCTSGNIIPNPIMMIKEELNISRNDINDDSYIAAHKEIGYITGADLFMPAQLFKEINGFDEKIFMYYEDADLQYRLHMRGFKQILIPGPKIIHLEGKSYSCNNKRRIQYDENRFYYLRKHFPFWEVSIFKFLFILIRIGKMLIPRYTSKENIQYLCKVIRY